MGYTPSLMEVRQEPEAGTDTETIKEHCLLACSPWLAQPVLLYNTRPPDHGGTAHSGIGPPTSISN